MDSKNIALVRATNIIPMDGKVRPLSKVPYIRKERGTHFEKIISYYRQPPAHGYEACLCIDFPYEYIDFMNAGSLGHELSILDKRHKYERVR